MWLIEGDYLKPFVKEKGSSAHTLSYHLLPKVYMQNASIYITKPSTIRNKKTPIGDVVIPFVMDQMESIDINNPLDFRFAEMILEDSRG